MVETSVDVDMGGRVDEGTSAAVDVGVVSFARDELRDLLHVGHPIDFSV